MTPANGFASQADVLIETRRAADLLGATPMDRPEDIKVDPANPRGPNRADHILELIPPQGPNEAPNHGADMFRWEMLLLAGQPGMDSGATTLNRADEAGWFVNPDNLAIDSRGQLCIATDGAPRTAGVADGLFVCETAGPNRALARHFFRAPAGAEVYGPCFTPDETMLFLIIQHPGEARHGRAVLNGWPDFDPNTPPRPAVVAITPHERGPVSG